MTAPRDRRPHEVHLWHADLRLQESGFARAQSLLNQQERERTARFKVPAAREQFVTSHAFLRLLLAEYLGTVPTDFQFEVGQHGKPFLAGNPNLKFNLSHTDGAAAVAISRDYEVGVDLERVRQDIDVLGLADRFFSPDEAGWIRTHSAAERARAFYLCWTAKEAYVKACGTGLSMPLARFSLIPWARQEKLTLQTLDHPSERDRWSIWQISLQPELCCAVAVHAPDVTVQVEKWDWNF